MRYRYHADYRVHESANAHFADLVAPMTFVGEAVHTAVEAAAGLVGQAFRAAKAKARERSAVNALSELDDGTLKDIGIPRSEIRYVARKLAENSGVDYRTMCQ
jgi:uncharacterized protein YjiS (DUF1127 family)